ncbi:MAG: DUF4143 domain-containing protein, partial [Algoriphagus sp.]
LWEQWMISERMKLNAANDYHPNYFFWRTYDGQEIDLLEIDSQQKMQGLEFKWSKANSKIPVAFAKAYPDAVWNEVSKESYFDWVV